MKNKYEIRGDVTAIFLRRKDGSTFEALNFGNFDDIEEAAEIASKARAKLLPYSLDALYENQEAI